MVYEKAGVKSRFVSVCYYFLRKHLHATSLLVFLKFLERFDIGMWYLLICGIIPWEASDSTTNAATSTDLAMTATSSTTVSTDMDMGAHEVREDFFDLSDFRKIKMTKLGFFDQCEVKLR